mgnify:FL=1
MKNILLAAVAMIALHTTAQTKQVICGYNYFKDTTWLPHTTCITKDSSIPYTCYSGKWWSRKKSTCYKDSSWQVCTKDSVIGSIKNDSTPKWCDAPTTVKPRLSGVAMRDFTWRILNPVDYVFTALIENYVINVKANEIWIGNGQYNWQPIEDAIAFAKDCKSRGIDVRFKLRIPCGVFAPAWTKQAFGSFKLPGDDYANVGWSQGADSMSVMWYKDAYLDAWAAFMAAIADRYDNNDFIAEITITGTSPATGEPLNLAIGNTGMGLQRKNAYVAAGFTDANRLAAIYRTIDAMKVFKRTNIGIALNPFEHFDRTATENQTSKSIGEYICKTFGSRSVLGNNGLRPAAVDTDWQPGGKIYDLCLFYFSMHQQYGSGIYFQTASTKQMGDYSQWIPTLDNGIKWSTQLVELPETERSIKDHLTTDQITTYKVTYKQNY